MSVGGIGVSDCCVGQTDRVGAAVGAVNVSGRVVGTSPNTGTYGAPECCSWDGTDDCEIAEGTAVTGAFVIGAVVGMYVGNRVGEVVEASEIGSKLLGER